MEEISYSDLKGKFSTIYYLLRSLYSLCFLNKRIPKNTEGLLNDLFINKYIDEYLYTNVAHTSDKRTCLFRGNFCKLTNDEKNKLQVELNMTIEEIQTYVDEKQKEYDLETKRIIDSYNN